MLLAVRAGAAGTDAVLALLWLPWLLAPVLAGLLGASALRGAAAGPWWHWLLATVPIPLGAAAVTTTVVLVTRSTAAGLLLSVAVQVAVTAGVALAVGAWRSARFARRPEVPVTYTTPHPEDQPA